MKILLTLFVLLFSSSVVQSDQIVYSTDSLKYLCIESDEDYAEGICVGYIRAHIEILIIEKEFCQNFLNRKDDIDDLVEIIISNLKLYDNSTYPSMFIGETLSKQFC